jgi:hypothetical protein
MPRIGFEPTTPVFEWAKTLHALDHTVTVIVEKLFRFSKFQINFQDEKPDY